jgi:MFS family permease
MFSKLTEFQSLRTLTPDGLLLFGTRTVRLFAYGFLSVILALYLTQLGLTEEQIGLLLTLTLVGDAGISLWITLVADRMGRRLMLIIGAGLMVFAGMVFAFTNNLALLTITAIIGTISPSGSEVGPFLSIEQAALPQTAPNEHRTQIFAWYNLVGSFATASGSLAGGLLAETLQRWGSTPLDSYRVVVIGYALLGVGLIGLFSKLSPAVEVAGTGELSPAVSTPVTSRFGLHRSRRVILKLSSLFMLDSFAGSLVVQSLIAYWFHIRFGVEPAALGSIFFGANIFAGLSALVAARIAARFGLINTMVFTHIPSNILLILTPLMPTLSLAVIVLLMRFSISQMDVPTRQSYIMAVVDPDERSAAAGVTTIARTAASSLGPVVTGALFGFSLLSLPFFLAGSLKIVYDLALYQSFRGLKPPEEKLSG